MTEEALDTFRRVVVTVALRQLGGQLVEEGPGRVLAAFCSAASAVRCGRCKWGGRRGKGAREGEVRRTVDAGQWGAVRHWHRNCAAWHFASTDGIVRTRQTGTYRLQPYRTDEPVCACSHTYTHTLGYTGRCALPACFCCTHDVHRPNLVWFGLGWYLRPPLFMLLAFTPACPPPCRWAASCEALLKAADWSEALLAHELCEEVAGPVLLDPNMEGESSGGVVGGAPCGGGGRGGGGGGGGECGRLGGTGWWFWRFGKRQAASQAGAADAVAGSRA